MRYLERITPLPKRVARKLEAYQLELERRLVDNATKKTRSELIDAMWKTRRQSLPLQAVEVALRAMASGLERCMYCDNAHGHQIEHFWPKTSYSEKTFEWENLLWVCSECNSHKNDRFDDRILNPTADEPLNHLRLTFSDGRFTVRNNSSRGTLTLERLTRLHDQCLVQGRKTAFDQLKLLLGRVFPVTKSEDRTQIRECVVKSPFSSVFAAVLRVSKERNAAKVLGPELMNVLAMHPEIYDWLETADKERRARALVEIEVIAQRIGVDLTEDEDATENET